MGLAERRRIATINDRHAPRFRKELYGAVGLDVPFETSALSGLVVSLR